MNHCISVTSIRRAVRSFVRIYGIEHGKQPIQVVSPKCFATLQPIQQQQKHAKQPN